MIFSKPISELEIEDVKAFCAGRLKEGFILEYKGDFTNKTDRLERVICAFANTWGGVLLIGVNEDAEGKPVLPIDGIKFEKGLDLRVTNKIMDNISPPVFVDKKVIPFKKDGEERAIIVVGVPESNMTPYTCDQGESIYVRTDERNKPYKRAKIERIEWLLDRRKKSEELKQGLYQNAIDRVKNICGKSDLWWNRKGHAPVPPQIGIATFSAIPSFPHTAYATVEKIRDICSHGVNKISILGQRTIQQGVITYRYDEGLSYQELNIYGLYFYQEPLLHAGVGGIFLPHLLMKLDWFLKAVKEFYDEINVQGLIDLRLNIVDIFGHRIRIHSGAVSENKAYWVSHQTNIEIERTEYKSELETKRFDILIGIIQEVGSAFNIPLGKDIVEELIEKWVNRGGWL